MKRVTWIGFLLFSLGIFSYEAMSKPTSTHRVMKPGQKCDSCHGGYDICLPPCQVQPQ